ncbi:two-component system, sensor histidine kinase YesM [Cohnella sp. OV330]|uniref:sensor histidine kinase n=1 Tax=Cohnella sp. OV330 TaxID=1855288 RepID=UPI0008ED2495|nr:histidine kinase [Cohnella sp. OV330]SFB58389.1 two-component system, sensor histidine kinase YesM [Cohnella sp. OV330]
MKWIKKIGSMPILPKIALTFLLVLTPLFYVGLQMNESGASLVRQEIGTSLNSRVELYMDILNSDFDRVIRMMREYVNDEDLMKLSTFPEIMPDIDRTEAILRLKQKMDLMKSSSAFIENAMVFIPKMDRIVSSNANAITDLDLGMFKALSGQPDPLDYPFTFWENRVFVTIPFGLLDGAPQFLLAVEISSNEITSILKQFTPDGSAAVLASNQSVWTTFREGPLKPTKDELAQLNPMMEGPTQTISIEGIDYLIAGKKSDVLHTKLIMMVPIKVIEKPLDRYRNWTFAWFGVSVLIIIAFAFVMYRLIHRPLMRLVRSFRKIEQGRFDVSVEYPFTDEFGYLYKQLNAMVRELKRLVHEVYEQQYRARLAELRHLQSQINPHFLYNTFFILYRMARQEGNESIERLTKHLGDYFQFITRDGAEEVTLASEAAHAKTYTEIQSIRFSNRITVQIGEIPAEAGQMGVPRLILQPIIENAFEHSLEKRAKGGLLEVDFRVTESELLIRVEDSGGIDEEKVTLLQGLLNGLQDVADTSGMINVHRRLQIKYGNAAGLRLSRGELGGLKVLLVIPIQEVTPNVSIARR